MRSASFLKKKWPINRTPVLSVQLQIDFFHRVSHILEKGYPLLEALSMTGWDARLKPVSHELIEVLKGGDTISLALEKARFSNTVTQYLAFSQYQDDLPKAFKQCRELLLMKKEYKEKFLSAVRYPVFLFLFLLLTFIIMKRTIIPNFTTLFADHESSPLTLMLLLNHSINIVGILVVFVLVIGAGLSLSIPRLPLKKRMQWIEKLPPLRMYHSYKLSFLFSSHLSSLFQAGLPLKDALVLLKEHKQDDVLSFYCTNILQDLSEGSTISSSLHQCRLLRKELTDLFHHTNDRHALKNELDMFSDFLMTLMQEKIQKSIQWIQPVFFVGIALVIVMVYAAIMLPLYQWMNQL
ncbi:hypothetical protein GLW04_07640 [Halobacillus litoralis]|uniref:Type II secretion system protein GspF domain-containing protein n=1 Tax=Halobacillus litoralis TaxID=45668 RepID=A0A845DSE2_9BACI|nr:MULTISPECIES: type II secretion system F family protein [Halobacillus]MYL19759.1 hypothetical protein [Halobacillus litoralis]MYL28905.1 hypothetical protein [Halobacillus halophilus]MYL37156.1 hypothetical protein [Halobacillus litoralis]